MASGPRDPPLPVATQTGLTSGCGPGAGLRRVGWKPRRKGRGSLRREPTVRLVLRQVLLTEDVTEPHARPGYLGSPPTRLR